MLVGGADPGEVNYGLPMTIYGLRRRVACYVTRTLGDRHELLVFEHADGDPADPSSVQVPAGGMATFESVDAAAAREVAEESGLSGLAFRGQLGAVDRGVDDAGGPSTTTFVHLATVDDGASSWVHTVTGDGLDSGMRFAFRWEPLPLRVELADGQAAFLDQLLA